MVYDSTDDKTYELYYNLHQGYYDYNLEVDMNLLVVPRIFRDEVRVRRGDLHHG